jgi:hypothetical protein
MGARGGEEERRRRGDEETGVRSKERGLRRPDQVAMVCRT